MKRLSFLVVSLVYLLCLHANPGRAQGTKDVACDPQGCISEQKFRDNIAAPLSGKVKAYSIIVGHVSDSAGYARSQIDPPTLQMTVQTPGNIASVSKTMTTVGALQLIAKNGLTIDSPISPYLYTDWTKGPNIDKITFKHLLTHKAGIRTDCNGSNTTYAVLKGLIAAGVTTADMGVAVYDNCNFALFRELFPALEGQSLNNIPDGDQRAQKSAAIYIDYMNKHVFGPAGVGWRACKPLFTIPVVLTYPPQAGMNHGDDWGDWTLSCGGGGWVISTHDIFAVVNSIASDNTLLTKAQRSQMVSDSLGLDSIFGSAVCPSPSVCKNGGLTNGSFVLSTYTGIFKCDVAVAVYVSSALPPPYSAGGAITALVKDAFNNATVPGTAKACP